MAEADPNDFKTKNCEVMGCVNPITTEYPEQHSDRVIYKGRCREHHPEDTPSPPPGTLYEIDESQWRIEARASN